MFRAKPTHGVAWITGASTGIGRAVALELVRRGWRVAATARNADLLNTLADEARALGGRVDPHPGDVTDRAGMAAMVAGIECDSGVIALAMLNAGGFFPDPRGEIIGESFRRTLTLNADGTLNCLEPLLPAMRERGRGQVAVMASVAGYGGLPTAASYCMAKSGLIALCESLRPTLAPTGIGMQVICPGYVRTPLSDQVKGPRPFLIEVDDAARRICNGFERGGFEIAFPRRMVWSLKALRRLPYPVLFWLMARGSGRYA